MFGSPRFAVRALSLAIATASVGFSGIASASMGNIGTTYRVMPIKLRSYRSIPIHV